MKLPHYGTFSKCLFMILFGFSASALAESKLTYEIKAKQKWNKDYETEKPDEDKDHFILNADASIDMLTSFADEKLLEELNKQGPEKTLAQILNAKNTIQSLVSDDPVIMKNSKVENFEHGRKISFETDFSYGTKKYHAIEHYFISQNKVLHVVLRWNEKSDINQLELAKADFKAIVVKIK